MNRQIILYMSFIVIAVWVGITYLFPAEFPAPDYLNLTIHNLSEFLRIMLTLVIFLRANYLYSKNSNMRMAIIAGGFLAGTLLGLAHIIFSHTSPIDFLTVKNLYNNPALFFLLIRRLAIASAIFIAIFYPAHLTPPKSSNFKRFIYASYFFVFVLAMILYILIVYEPEIDHIKRFLLLGQQLKVIEITFLLTSAFIYVNTRLDQSKTAFSNFIIGLFLLATGDCFLLNAHSMSFYDFIAGIIRLFGYLLVLSGIEELDQLPQFVSITDKLLSYGALILVLFYTFFVYMSSLIFNINFPSYASAVFLEFLLIISALQYMLFTKFTRPILTIIRTIEKYKPGEKTEKVPIITNDEIGILAQKMNERSELIWNYTQELLKLSNREHFIFLITNIIRNSIGINSTKKNIVTEIGKYFNADRVIIRFADLGEKIVFPVDEFSEYRLSDKVKSLTGVEVDSELQKFFFERLNNKENIIFAENIKEYLEEQNYNGTSVEDFTDEYNIKSAIIVFIFHESDFIGNIGIHFEKYVKFSGEDAQFINLIGEQVGIALYQEKLHEQLNKTANKEKLLADIIAAFISRFDFEEIKNIVVEKIGKALKADRCYINPYDDDLKKFLPVNNEFLSSPDVKSIVGHYAHADSPEFAKWSLEGKDMISTDVDKFIEENNLQNTGSEKYLIDYDVKSGFSLPIRFSHKLLGSLVIHYSRKNAFNEEDMEFVRTVIGQLGIALYQAKLFDSAKQTVERENLLKTIIEKIRSSLDINETLTFICDEVAKLFNVQRAAISEFYDKNDRSKFIPRREYKTSIDIIGLFDIYYDPETGRFIGETVLEKGIYLVLDNISESNVPDYFKATYELMGVKSALCLPIRKDSDKFGTIFLAEYNYYRHWAQGEINLLEAITGQIYIAIKQAELYEKVKQNAEKEKFLSQIMISAIESTGIEETLKTIVTETGKFLNVDRCFYVEYDFSRNAFFPAELNNEYNASADIKKMSERPFTEEESAPFAEYTINQRKMWAVNNIYEASINTAGITVLEEYEIKSFVLFPIFYQDIPLGMLAVNSVKNFRNFTQEEIDLLSAIASQSAVILYQKKLYNSIQQTAERETLLRKITETIRSSLDIDEINKQIVKEIGQTLNTDRCFIIKYNQSSKKLLPVESEYLSSLDIKSLLGANLDEKVPDLANIAKKGKEILVTDSDKYIPEHNLHNTPAEKYLVNYNIKSGFSIPIFYANRLFGVLAIHYVTKKGAFSDQEVELVRTLANQIGIAFYQSELYEKVKQTAERERILREIIAEIKISQNLSEVYESLVTKTAKIFDANRSIFIEIPEQENELPIIKYQYLKTPDDLPLEISEMPVYCLKNLFETANKEGLAIIRDTAEHDKEDNILQEFFVKFNIKSVLLVPLIRYNHDIKLLGALVLCFGVVKDWCEEEINLLKAITASTVDILWEIKKRIELEELRNVFILTLTHDLQVPLVGERKALEFIASRPIDQPIGKFINIINDLLNSNESLAFLLKKLLDSYNYESKNQILQLEKQNLNVLIDQAIIPLKKSADAKKISIEIQIEPDLPHIEADGKEIKKVLTTLLENSISYIQNEGHIIVRGTRQKNKVITCVVDNGPGIPLKTRGKIFERYAMALTIERKIGAGLSLYLAKQIIEAHKGRIWYETEMGKGTSFCFSLPIV